MTSWKATKTEHIQSLLFSLFFAPLAITLMCSSVVSVLAATAVGQPLSSSMGIIGTLIAGGMIGLISFNSMYSNSGIVALCVWSMILLVLDYTSWSPTAWTINLTQNDIAMALSWSQFRLSMTMIFVATAVVLPWIRRAAEPLKDKPAPLKSSVARSTHQFRVRTTITILSALFILSSSLLFMSAAPRDSLNVAWQGITGMALGHPEHEDLALMAGALLAAVILMCRWSASAPITVIALSMIIPNYILLPMWASLTGQVVTPGMSLNTAIQMSSPIMMALGTCMLGACVGPLHLRHILRRHFFPADPF